MNKPSLNEDKPDSFKRRKLNTHLYFHKTFFVEGNESDVTLVALNKDWNLHTIFLKKSPYFQSMFGGCWIESNKKQINIGIEDPNITIEVLHKVFESFYVDEIVIEPTEAVPILACATLFQLDDLISNCTEVMKACINPDTVVPFYEASDRYGVKEVRDVSLDWLYLNAYSMISSSPMKLALFSVDLMRELVNSHRFCESEDNIYRLLLAWMYLREHPSESFSSLKALTTNAFLFLITEETETPFFETDCGILYQSLFSALRLHNLILYDEFKRILRDNVFPKEWYQPVIEMQWLHMLKIHKGPSRKLEYGFYGRKGKISEEEFNAECIRTSGLIKEEKTYSFKDFDFGFGLAFHYERGHFYIMRDLKSEDDFKPVSSASPDNSKRHIMYRLTLYSVDCDSIVICKEGETCLSTASLAPNEFIEVLTVKHPIQYQLKYALNCMFITPSRL